MIGIFVNDLDRMAPFYRDVLGLKISWDGKGPYAEFEHEGMHFSMYEKAQLPRLLGETPTYPNGLNGTFELAIDLPTAAEADREFERICKAGGRPVYGPQDEPWGMHSTMLADPEGNMIKIDSWNSDAKGAG
jgi:predicted enzyme related to lactoylglutathione lyase